MKSITDIENLAGKRVLVRVDFNVTLGEDNVVNENESLRIQKGLPTLKYLKDKGARVIVIGHIGREPHETLRPVAEYLNNNLQLPITFIPSLVGEEVEHAIANLGNGEIIMLENLRSNDGEEANDESFAKTLASYADIYVNDAFSVSHRDHASLVSVPRLLPSYAGFELLDEIKHLDLVRNPEHPLVVIMGGAKFETKLDLMKQMLPIATTMIVGGALANRIYRERGFEIGTSLSDDEGEVHHFAESEKVLLPDMVITKDEHKAIGDVTAADAILDVDIMSIPNVEEIFMNAKTILWNGPLGYYEGGFTKGTKDLAHMIARSSGTSIVGGGDTVTVLFDEKILNKFTFVSMAGGAMLDYLVHGTLPGIEALK